MGERQRGKLEGTGWVGGREKNERDKKIGKVTETESEDG